MIFIVSLVVAYNEEHLVAAVARRDQMRKPDAELSGADFEWNESARYNRGSKQRGGSDRGVGGDVG